MSLSGAPRNLLLAALLLAGIGPGLARAEANGWHSDFETARRRAEQLDRPILVHFYAEWCAPCKRMDRDVLYAPEFLEALHQSVVPVKLDVSQHRKLSERYEVESVPTDLFLAPDGRVLGMMNGYRKMADYLARVAAIEQQFSAERDIYWAETRQRSRAAPVTRSEPPELPAIELPSGNLGPARELSDLEPDRSRREPVRKVDPPALHVKPREDGTILVGLEGYSPVSLLYERKWVRGDPAYDATYQGLTYLMTSAAEQKEFEAHAERFAPRLLGCDPVLYFDEGRAVPGSTQLAVFYDERLYLFSSAETRAAFRESPKRYARMRTVLLPEELAGILR